MRRILQRKNIEKNQRRKEKGEKNIKDSKK